MPTASEEQVPKALTYTLMYHFLWCVMFTLSAVALAGIFLASGWPLGSALAAPLGLVFFAAVAGIGALATYVVRVQVLLGQLSRAQAFRWSAVSSWGVLLFAPVAWLLWHYLAVPRARSLPEQMSGWFIEVEVIVWWLSHLLSVRGLSRGRRRHDPAAAPQLVRGRAAPAGAALVGEARQ